MLHRQQGLTWRLVVKLDHSVPDIETATSQTVAIIGRRLDTIGVRDAKVNVLDAKAVRIHINQYVGFVLNDEIKSTALYKIAAIRFR
jgi:hypothetical protein